VQLSLCFLIVIADPTVKDHVKRFLASNSNHHQDASYSDISTPSSSPVISTSTTTTTTNNRGHRISSSDSSACRKSRIPVNNITRIPSLSAPQSPQTIKPRYQQSHIPTANGVASSAPVQQQQQQQKKQQPRFEAYMMTGDLILNLSRTPQSSGLLPAQTKKVDSLRDSPVRSLKRKNGTAPKAIYDSSPSESSSPSLSLSEVGALENAESNNNNNNNNRKSSKLSKMITSDGNHRLNQLSVDEEEEQLIMDHGSPSQDDRRTKYNLTNRGCAITSSNSSSASSPTNSSNSPNNNENYDGGGSDEQNAPASRGSGLPKRSAYSVLQNEEQQQQQQLQQHVNVTPSASMSSTTTTSSASTTINRSETLLTPTPDISHSVPTSPTSLSTPLLDAAAKQKEQLGASSVPTSPECLQQDVVRRNSSNSQQNGIHVRKCDASGFRTSRSEDHLQHSQREGTMGNAIPIDIDEDVNSSLNTLLDTRHDSEDSQVRSSFSLPPTTSLQLSCFRALIVIESCGHTMHPYSSSSSNKRSCHRHLTQAPSAHHLNTPKVLLRQRPFRALS